jgi:hypothetical protein
MERNNDSEVGSNLGPSLRVVAQHPHKNLFLKSGVSCPIISYIFICWLTEEMCSLRWEMYIKPLALFWG